MASQVNGWIGQINPGDGTNYAIGSTAYGVCATAASTATKVVEMTGFELKTGATIHVKFVNGNTVLTNLKLNVNNSGDKNIIGNGLKWPSGSVVSFTYDGTSWASDYNMQSFYGKLTAEVTNDVPMLRYIRYLYDGTDGTTSATNNISLIAGDNITIRRSTLTSFTFASPNQIIYLNFGTCSSLPQTINSTELTDDHVVLRMELSNPDAQVDDWTFTSTAGIGTLSGTISGSTSIVIIAGKASGLS